MFTRANLAAHGQRFVQVARSSDLISWSPFELISIAGYRPEEGNLYTFAAQKNPVHAGSLLAVTPVVHRLRGCLALTLSVDGRNWSSLQPLLPCHAYGERASFQPVSGGVTLDGDTVSFWVHRSVPSISFGALTPE